MFILPRNQCCCPLLANAKIVAFLSKINFSRVFLQAMKNQNLFIRCFTTKITIFACRYCTQQCSVTSETTEGSKAAHRFSFFR